MNCHNLLGKHFVAFLLLASAFTCSRATAAVPPPEKLLPEDTLFLLTIPDFTKARELYRTWPQSQFWTDPAMKPFKDKFMSKLSEEFIEPLERELNIKFEQFTSLAQGQVTFATSQNGWNGRDEQKP